MATKWVRGRESLQHEYPGQRDDSSPGWDGAGQHEISSHYSECGAI